VWALAKTPAGMHKVGPYYRKRPRTANRLVWRTAVLLDLHEQLSRVYSRKPLSASCFPLLKVATLLSVGNCVQ
jgi:hypothetical protein